MFEKRRAYPLVLIALILGFVTRLWFFAWLAVILAVILLVRPQLLTPTMKVFEKFTKTLGTLISNTVLTSIFYIFVVPYGFLYRRFNQDLVRHFHGETKNTPTFFKRVDRIYSKDLFEKQW